jgi:hypothetical protein
MFILSEKYKNIYRSIIILLVKFIESDYKSIINNVVTYISSK